MTSCMQCNKKMSDGSRFCSGCGSVVSKQAEGAAGRADFASPTYLPPAHAEIAKNRDSTQMFGLDPRVVALTVAVDTMLFGTEVVTLGAGVALSIPVGVAVGIAAYKMQRHWYGDDHESAMIKGLIVGVLTAIPTSLPGFLTIPSGLMGLARLLPKRGGTSRLA